MVLERKCKVCGKICYGKYCRKCFLGKDRLGKGSKFPVGRLWKADKRK